MSKNTYSRNPAGERHHGEYYTSHNRFPTVQRFNAEEKDRQEKIAREEAEAKSKGFSRIARDPITGGSVQVKDSAGDYAAMNKDLYISVPARNVVNDGHRRDTLYESHFNSEGLQRSELRENEDAEHRDQTTATTRKDIRRSQSRHEHPGKSTGKVASDAKAQQKQDQREDDQHTHAHDEDGWVDLPMRGNRTNVLFYTLPDPDFDTHHKNVTEWFMKLPMFICCCEVFRYFVFNFGRLTAIILYGIAGYWIRAQMDIAWHSTKLDTVERRAEQALAKRVPESVEWLNAVLSAVWKQINPDILGAAVNKLEDIMQASSPSIVHAVKIDDVGHGDHPIRLLNMRYLDKEEISKEPGGDDSERHSGDFVNMELSVAYAAKPSGSTIASKVKNMHLLIIFFGGLADVMAVPIPVWVEVQGFLVTLRARMQFTPGFPYIKNTTFSLMGLPKFDISVVPIHRRLISITNLPIISTFVKDSINAACNEYVAPRSYSINIGSILAGDGISREVVAVGTLMIKIYAVTDLSENDGESSHDPYVVVAFSNYGRPMYSTRIIEKTRNPIFNETCFVLVTPEALRSQERLSLQLWNSGRLVADKEYGRIEFDLQDLVRRNNSSEEREDSLVSSSTGSETQGVLRWSVGYYSKRKCNMSLASDGSDPNLASDIKSHEDMTSHRDLPRRDTSAAVSFCSPDPEFPSGIFRIQIHQAIDLYATEPKGSKGQKMWYQEGHDTSAPEIEEDESQSPSAYCNIILNDAIIYKTRTKPFSSKPFFNAGAERFVRDWRSAVCLVSVRDSRTKEHDALLGVIPLKLSEVFTNASQVTKNFPLIGGVGEAKVRISLLWESVSLKIPTQLYGWDIGVLRITSSQIEASHLVESHGLKNSKLKFFTNKSLEVVPRSRCLSENDNCLRWDIHDSEHSLDLPCIRRHASALCIEFHAKARRHATAIAILWLSELEDSHSREFHLPIWRVASEESRYFIRQQRITNDEEMAGQQKLGTLVFKASFLQGLGNSQAHQVKKDTSLRQVHESWLATIAHGERESDDAYLVGRRTQHNADGNPGDGQFEGSNCAKSARFGDKENSGINSHPDGHVDEDGRDITDASARVAAKTQSTYQRLGGTRNRRSFDSQGSGATNMSTVQTSSIPDCQTTHGGTFRTEYLKKELHSVSDSQSQSIFDINSNDSRPVPPSSSMPSVMSTSRMEEKERKRLNSQQRGAMQFKAFRSLKWAKDGVQLGTTKLGKRFKILRSREPDVQAEP